MARYRIKSIEKITPPEGTNKLQWYKFIIENDKNYITNMHSGSKKEIQEFAAEQVKSLNEKYFTHVYFKVHKPVYEMELWRWKMIRKVADYINQPDDITMSEFKAMIESYSNHYNIKELVYNRFKQEA